MKDGSNSSRVDTASRIIKASQSRIYQSFINPQELISWLPPKGMSGGVDRFDAHEGGCFKLTLTYEIDHYSHGKTTNNTDVVQGKFLELIPNERIVQSVTFRSDDPAFQGEMIQTWLFEAHGRGTKVTILCEEVPEGIGKEDHDAGLQSTLENLASYVEDSP